jgi:hypothetical protein
LEVASMGLNSAKKNAGPGSGSAYGTPFLQREKVLLLRGRGLIALLVDWIKRENGTSLVSSLYGQLVRFVNVNQ